MGILKMRKNNFKVLELKSSKNKNTSKRSVLIKDFIINEIIGIHKYEKITNKLKNLAKNKNYNFLESLAEDSFKKIFEDKRINSVKIKIEKPEAIANAQSVGVEVFKSRNDYEGS